MKVRANGVVRYVSGGGGSIPTQPQPQPQLPVQSPPQPSAPTNIPVVQGAVAALAKMTDDQLTQLYNASKTVDMPNFLADVSDKTQRFVYQAGINELPQVLDDKSFDAFLQTNNIPRSNILARSVDSVTYRNPSGTMVKLSPQQISAVLKSSRFNYIGGKRGGQLSGAGTYFDMNGGHNTGYGSYTLTAVLNPATARVIPKRNLYQQVPVWSASHPKFVSAVGSLTSSNMSIYALAMGYNVITSSSYHNVIDRSALVYRARDN